ncbi:Spy/CpxP family protein refolding chaperone [Lacinutrix undariae]
MKKNLILYILLVFLILANGFFLVNYLGRPEAHQGNKGPGDFLSKELNFDAAQMQEFKKLNKNHHKNIEDLLKELQELKHELFIRSYQDIEDAIIIDSIASRIGENEKQKDLLSFKYFKSIRALCNDTQKKEFKNLIEKSLKGGERVGAPDHERRGRDENENPPPPPPPRH